MTWPWWRARVADSPTTDIPLGKRQKLCRRDRDVWFPAAVPGPAGILHPHPGTPGPTGSKVSVVSNSRQIPPCAGSERMPLPERTPPIGQF